MGKKKSANLNYRGLNYELSHELRGAGSRERSIPGPGSVATESCSTSPLACPGRPPNFLAKGVPLSALIRAWCRCAKARIYTRPRERIVSMERNVAGAKRRRHAGTELARLVGPDEIAVFLGVPLRTVYRWRSRGEGPPGYRVGRHVRYRVEDVDRWLAERRDQCS
jgi:excisionase family DNA binding protein